MMMINEQREMKPYLVKFGVALALSFAGFLYSRIRTKRIKPCDPSPPPPVSECGTKVDYDGRLRIEDDPQPEIDSIDASDKPCIQVRVGSSSKHASPNGRYSADRDGFLLPTDFDVGNLSKSKFGSFRVSKDLPKSFRKVERVDYEQEIKSLNKRIKFLLEREKKLEIQLLEFYGLQEQEAIVMDLQNRLKIHSMEDKLFMMEINNLQEENKRLAGKAADFSKVMTQLEAAKVKIKLLKRKIRYDSEQNKEQILNLTKRVVKLQEQEHEVSTSHSDDQSDVQRLNELEAEAEGLRKCNELLQKENADLAQRLESTQILANSLFEDPEAGFNNRQDLHQAMFQLREENDKLKTEVEKLQDDRCADTEELVYLRWINACLRYELRNYKSPPGKTVARDLSKCLSPTSEKKAKQLILEYANTEDGADREPGLTDFDIDQWPSSQPSYLTDNTDQNELRSPSSSQKPHSMKVKVFGTLRKFVRGKSNHNDKQNQSAQTSPMYRSLAVNDIAGHFGSRSNLQSPKFGSSYQNSNNSSLEYQRLASLKEDENVSRMSHSRSSSSPGGVRSVLGRESAGRSGPLDYTPEWIFDSGQNSDLVKYAEVVRDNSVLPKHKKSASFHAG